MEDSNLNTGLYFVISLAREKTFSNFPKCLVSKQTVQNSVDCFLPQKNIWLSSIWKHSWMPTIISPKTISKDIRMPWGFSSQLIAGNSSKRLLCFYFRTSVTGLCLEREDAKLRISPQTCFIVREMPYPHVLEMVHSFSGRKKTLLAPGFS